MNLNPLGTTSSAIPTGNQQPINELLAYMMGCIRIRTLGNLKMMNYHNRLEVKIHLASQGGEIFKITHDDNFFGQGVIAGNNDYNFGSNIHLVMREGLNLD